MAKPLCDECSAAMLKLLDERIGRILEAGRTDAEYREVGQSHCFHLMEIKQIIEGKPTCGVYDNFAAAEQP